MSKREKIILVFMALTVVYGFYALFVDGPPRHSSAAGNSESRLEAFHKFITSVATMTKDGLSEIDSYIIEHIPAKWTTDPLLRTKGAIIIGPDETDGPPKELNLVYSGFLSMGDKSLAIINGMEYEAGESLPQTDYVVGKILPNRVVILSRGGRKRVSVPIEETQ